MPSIDNAVKKGTDFEPEAGRYVLYAAWFCPFAGRVLLMRKLKGLEDVVEVVHTNTVMDENRRSWTFRERTYPDKPDLGIAGTVPEPVYGLTDLRELYEKHAKGPVEPPFPVPTLWDRKRECIVSNESAPMMRWFATAFDELLPPEKAKLHFVPSDLEKQIDELYSWGAPDIANGVYKAGFATAQEAYDKAIPPLFEGLDKVEKLIEKNGGPYVWGDRLTESDVWLFTCIVRFDVVYHSLFKCNVKSIRADYPHIHRWLRNLYWNHEEFRDVTNFEALKNGYYAGSSRIPTSNPTRIIPVGPVPHILPLDDRDSSGATQKASKSAL